MPVFRNAVVTIGTFDGVHKGHKHILAQLKAEAGQISGETVIITFHPHPRKIVGSSHKVALLTTLEEKTELLSEEGIDHLVVIPFDQSFAEQTAEAYVRDFLVRKIHPHTIILGYDHHFGKNREGNYLMLENFGRELGFCVKEISEKVLNEVAISSTGIRKALKAGHVQEANALLGYPYFFSGKVVSGNKIGRTLGYPTANLEIQNPEKLIPAIGIYAVNVKLNDRYFKGMMSIGIRPTIKESDGRIAIEVNIFDFDEDIYDQTLTVFVKCFLREEQKFPGLEAMKIQLAKDRELALQKLG
ncbi:MAG: bifunctional riboflavin kinase/FAD synthetase [Chitinophagaceae bacterium]|nr:bifunctional riboflavin kinase/FAD synthetase [Chitinophagaceae bacterium]